MILSDGPPPPVAELPPVSRSQRETLVYLRKNGGGGYCNQASTARCLERHGYIEVTGPRRHPAGLPLKLTPEGHAYLDGKVRPGTLTPRMVDSLRNLARVGTVDPDEMRDAGVHGHSATSLVNRGLAERKHGTITITEQGRQYLADTARKETTP